MQQEYYLGIMSGTSLDGVDVALMAFTEQPQFIAGQFTSMPTHLRQDLLQLVSHGTTTLQQLGELDQRLALLYADAVNRFLTTHNLPSQHIRAIGCHGQTVWHAPQGDFPFTLQIGDMHLLAARTDIDVVGDFRRKDMAFGGQGAPLVPAFHQALFYDERWATVVLNIGGISNISVLLPHQPIIGYDTGTGNALMDGWIERHLGKSYDADGQWARSGKVRLELLAEMLKEPYFQLPPPKSTGRELFNLAWLEKTLAKTTALLGEIPPQDVQATLLEFTAQSIALALNRLETELPRRLLVCGGGAKNGLLMERLQALLPNWQYLPTNDAGLDVDYVEAAAFAWLAYRRINNLPSNLPSVTGAKSAVSLGAIFPAEKIS
ncbi:anhydro-N-acetylmuramic acid kinase [Aggregatibacter actinomycetemcomitans serotype e str. SC1083]|uniref:Anhydro-N-acetylmuramic acid kinase n=1 Tax=Aggregatibacter actinomycetemcomitans serotype e str. SC1083 TaxID=907488 RepID=G4A9F9_AGGAC|nr:anhydro-N-acetylmuramic acid kinase [Aggregatibacter actinomycetemcomitans]EGY33357.1 anhydro-N-acetylmuramic acid kinase [Aggregatibacter actinomycetemcomitans serotype e str. SC1083]KYK76499.1 anhydro-N-acetylmuramic acid kinase [Aggregatibacter actinomycetemcomitans serotype e str. SA3096]KYK82371.1 anhydro-N-acetylmuramic acid kinase [Aggregatibacter actinomycetemcomitans serotype e str. SC936]KYK95201.1 anhydro-N-acetylmuramic acid kinase [Aggregatibacter actinomycetemcomitans serotype 